MKTFINQIILDVVILTNMQTKYLTIDKLINKIRPKNKKNLKIGLSHGVFDL